MENLLIISLTMPEMFFFAFPATVIMPPISMEVWLPGDSMQIFPMIKFMMKSTLHLFANPTNYGIDTTQVYYPGNAGLLYEVFNKENILCRSNAKTLSRMSHAYLNHRMHIITGQLGFSYGYDASREDSWLTENQPDFSSSTIVEQSLPLRLRPCKKLVFSSEVIGREYMRHSDTDIIFDLSSEQVGFLSFHLQSPCIQNITISYGEHLVSDFVPRKIGTRDFSIFYRTKEGENIFFNPFRRLGCRYLEVHSEFPVKIEKIAITPTTYPLREQSRPLLTQQQSRIYDMCVFVCTNTMKIVPGASRRFIPWTAAIRCSVAITLSVSRNSLELICS